MLPESKTDAVKKALLSTFGTDKWDDIRQLTTGLSNSLVFRIVVKGRPYLLKTARTDALSDPTLYYYACMKEAAVAGIAPFVWYAGVEDGISLTDFIELKPFPLKEAQYKLPQLLRRVHSLPPFSKTIHSLDTANMFALKFREAGIMPSDKTEVIFRALERITAVYPRDKEELVPSHNDLKPENILYDGSRAWLSDWEAAFTNDRYSDLSIVANFVVDGKADEAEFLGSYFGRAATEYELARFFLMRQVMNISYFVVFMYIVAKKVKLIAIESIARHDFREYHSRMWNGNIDLAPDEAKLEYALVHMDQLLLSLQTKRFEEALRIITAKRHF